MSGASSSPPTARHTQLLALASELRPELHRYCARLMGSVIDGEDVVQDTFTRAFVALDELGEDAPMRAWLFRIAANLISDRWQRSGREVQDDSGQIDSAQVSPAEIEEIERRATLFRLVDTLPAEQQRVVVLRFVEQKSIKEVAREIRKTEGAVKQLQFRAITSLRARMEGADA